MSQSSHASSDRSDKNKNLIAAKASLGLISTPGSTSSSSSHQRKAKQSSFNSASSPVSASTNISEVSRKYPASAQEDAQRFSSNLRNNSRRSDEDSSPTAEKSVQSNSDTYETTPSKSVSFMTVDSDSELSSSLYEDYYDHKLDYSENTGAGSLQSIKEETNSVLSDSNVNASEISDLYRSNDNVTGAGSDMYHSNINVAEGNDTLYDSSNTSAFQGSDMYASDTNFEGSDFYASNANMSERSDDALHDSYNTNNQSHQSFDDTSEDFVPQRFHEMRSLLASITPMQLESLVQEIFGNNGPEGWRLSGKRSKRGYYRKDAYLSEMSLEELQHFARLMDNLGLEYCSSSEEALDVIAIEFERLVTLHQITDEQNNHVSEMQHPNSLQSNFMESIDEDHETLDSGRTSEADNLRKSLRACSFAELRLVAERLRLDHSVCVRKGDLIRMIETSMPNIVDSYTQDSQSPPFRKEYAKHQQPPTQAPTRRKSSERGKRKVKFEEGTKAGKSLPSSQRKGNAGEGYDFESAPLVPTDADGTTSSRFSVLRKHMWKIIACLLLLVLIIALSAGLSARTGKGRNDANAGRSYVLFPENDIFSGGFDASSPTLSPSHRPTYNVNQGQPSFTVGGAYVINSKPTKEPSAYPTEDSYVPTEGDTILPTLLPTLLPTVTSQIETEKPSPLPRFSITTAQPMESAQPTLSPFPLLGPFEETDMRMVLYGISDLSQMGITQFKMLTAAYVEQFYNEEGRGADAIQNIVFDVSASIDITSLEPHSARRRERRTRNLQSGALVITFTMKLSYRSFSTDLDAKTVSERPFLEESMHADFVQFLRDNNAAKFVGNINDVTSIFRGNDIPGITFPQVENDNSPAVGDTYVETSSPSRIPVATPTPKLVSEPKPVPIPIITASSPTLSPTPFPTYIPTKSSSPTTYAT